jgi:hypothetical protein
MKRFALCALTLWLCQGSTAWADVVPGGMLGAGTKVYSFFVMCGSGERSDICTDFLKLNPSGLVKAANLAPSDPILRHLGVLDSGGVADWSQKSGDSGKFSPDSMTTSLADTIASTDDERISTDPSTPTSVPEPASVPVIGACLAIFAIALLRTRTYSLRP